MTSPFETAISALEEALERSAHLRSWLRDRRWCGDSLGMRADLAVKDRALLFESPTEALVLFMVVVREPQGSLPLHLPLSVSTTRRDPQAFELPAGRGRLYVAEAEGQPSYARFVADGFRDQTKVRTVAGDTLQFRGTSFGAFQEMGPGVAGDTSNILVHIRTSRQDAVFKSYKFLDIGNREPVILERLHRKRFPHVPPFFGELSLGREPDRLVLGVATAHVDAVDLFTWLTEGWHQALSEPTQPGRSAIEDAGIEAASDLGEATAALHEILVDRHPGPFAMEPFRPDDAMAAYKVATANLGDALRRLGHLAKDPDRVRSDRAVGARQRVFDARRAIEHVLAGLEACVGTPKGVTHADLHLGQVLRRRDNGALLFIDFEGEPERPPGQRSIPLPPLRDVGTMNRSFAYVRHYAWREFIRGDASAALRLLSPAELSQEEAAVANRLRGWERAAVERYTQQYLGRSSLYQELEPAEALRGIRGWMMEKALYELRYELKHRPENIFIPLEGVLSLAGAI